VCNIATKSPQIRRRSDGSERMTVRVKVTPDADGVVRLTCGGSDLELEVQPAAGGGSSTSPGGTSSAGGSGHNPIGDTILSLRGATWRVSGAEAEALGQPTKRIAIDADTIDVHAVAALAERYERRHPTAPKPLFHINLNPDDPARR
jgi:hypothetical protein